MSIFPNFIHDKKNSDNDELIKHFKPIWEIAIKEDYCDNGMKLNNGNNRFISNFSYDITTSATINFDNKNVNVKGVVKGKEKLVICGLPLISYIFSLYDFTKIEFLKQEGDWVSDGETILNIEGPINYLLGYERIFLNFMQHLSGIATKTRSWLELIAENSYQLFDTRKTLPGYRFLDKYAVYIGKGQNHRFNLYSSYLIKDNHIKYCKSINTPLQQVMDHSIKNNYQNKLIEIECNNYQEVIEVKKFADKYPNIVSIIMLDNFKLFEIKKTVELIKKNHPKCLIEISGGIDEEKIKQLNQEYFKIINELGVSFDFVSSGSITNSAPAVDISFNIEK